MRSVCGPAGRGEDKVPSLLSLGRAVSRQSTGTPKSWDPLGGRPLRGAEEVGARVRFRVRRAQGRGAPSGWPQRTVLSARLSKSPAGPQRCGCSQNPGIGQGTKGATWGLGHDSYSIFLFTFPTGSVLRNETSKNNWFQSVRPVSVCVYGASAIARRRTWCLQSACGRHVTTTL